MGAFSSYAVSYFRHAGLGGASIGKVSLLQGEAVASRDQKTISLFNGATLEEHDVITTRENSHIQLIFEDKTVITLGSSSVMDIQEYLNDAQQPKAKFKFNQGTFKTITGEIGKKAPENFNLETKTATIGIRGTTVVGEIGTVSGNGIVSDTIGCASGQIIISNAAGSLLLQQGFQTLVLMGQPPAAPVVLSPSLGVLLVSYTPPTPQTPSLPSLAEQASQTQHQSNTADLISATVPTPTENNNNSFYPTFNPPLQGASTNDGIVILSGFVTSQYRHDGTTTTSIEDTVSLVINSTNDSLSHSETISDLSLNHHLDNLTYLNLSKTSSPSTMTYKNINEFSIKDFDAYNGWIQTENSYPNDYVTWGYWALKINDDTKLLPTTNYWVAGVDSDAADAYIKNIPQATAYTYNGHVLGSVTNGANSYGIDPTNNNAVVLTFDFGAGCDSLAAGSYIKFQTTQTTPQLWQVNVSGFTEGGSFMLHNTANVAINTITDTTSSSTIKGTFYGDNAQAVGGTFKATAGTSTASGVFKAIK